MPHKDLIIDELTIEHEGVIDFKDFLKFLKLFMKKYDYNIDENIYETKTSKQELKTTLIVWGCDRKVDDYNKIIIKPKIILSDYKEGTIDRKKIIEGKIEISIKVEIERDYDENWKKSPIKRFFRAVYDKYVVEAKQEKINSEAKNIVSKLKTEINQYFNE